MKAPFLIGITGGIGSGKSRVSRFWAVYAGLPLVDVDQLCRELLTVDMPGWAALKSNLGATYLLPGGAVDRKKLRAAMFSDDGLRKTLDSFMHPLAHQLLVQKTEQLSGPVLVDVPLLFEAGWEAAFARTVVVFADRQACCRRVSERDQVAAEEAGAAVTAQIDTWEKVMRADHVIDNRYCWLWTRVQVVGLDAMIRNVFGR